MKEIPNPETLQKASDILGVPVRGAARRMTGNHSERLQEIFEEIRSMREDLKASNHLSPIWVTVKSLEERLSRVLDPKWSGERRTLKGIVELCGVTDKNTAQEQNIAFWEKLKLDLVSEILASYGKIPDSDGYVVLGPQ